MAGDSCPCCTPLTRVYTILVARRGFIDTLLQRILCHLFDDLGVDAVAVVREVPPNAMNTLFLTSAPLIDGGFIASKVLSMLAMNSCSEVDPDAIAAGVADAFRVEDLSVHCTCMLPRALSKCIPKGFSALVVARDPLDAKIMTIALALRGYKRVHIGIPRFDQTLAAVQTMFGIDMDVHSIEEARHYISAVDVILDSGVLGPREELPEQPPRVEYRLEPDNPSLPCLLGYLVSELLSYWESLFVEPERVSTLAKMILYS